MLVNRKYYSVPSVAPQIRFLLQQCLNERDAGRPLLPASDHPPTSFPVAVIGTISAILSL